MHNMHHIWSASCHAYVVVYRVLIVCSILLLLDRVSKAFRVWGFVLLRWLVFFMDSIFFQAGSQARWSFPWIPLLSLPCHISCFYCCLATYHLYVKPPKYHDKPLTPPHPSKPLFGYVTACSTLLIALLVAGASSFHLQHGYFVISQYYCYLI